VDQLTETEHVGVELRPAVHLAEFDVGHDVIDQSQSLRVELEERGFDVGPVAREERSRVIGSIDEGVDGLAVCLDGGGDDLPALVFVGSRRAMRFGSPLHGQTERVLGVGHRKGDVLDAVSVLELVSAHLRLGAHSRREDEADAVLLHHIAGPVANSGLRSGVGGGRETEHRAVVVRRLFGIADVELEVVIAQNRHRVVVCHGGVLLPWSLVPLSNMQT
jgi:hypothetical protein